MKSVGAISEETLKELLERIEGYPNLDLVGYISGVPVYSSPDLPEDNVFFLTQPGTFDLVASEEEFSE